MLIFLAVGIIATFLFPSIMRDFNLVHADVNPNMNATINYTLKPRLH